MKRFFTALALVMLAIGALALFLTPIFWLPEPVLAFQVGHWRRHFFDIVRSGSIGSAFCKRN